MGAQRAEIFKIAVGEGALIVAFGLAAGFVGSLVLTRFLQTMLFDVKSTDPITLGHFGIVGSGRDGGMFYSRTESDPSGSASGTPARVSNCWYSDLSCT